MAAALRKGVRAGTATALAQPQRAFRHLPGQYGKGGRNSVNDITVAVFGATGFLGRYLANKLGQTGTRCYLPSRGDDMETRFLRPMFDLGQVWLPFYSPNDEASVRAAIADADVVVNLIGKYYETKHAVPTRRADGKLSRVISSFEKANVEIPGMLARLSKEAGVKKFVHVSALAADADSPSRWARTKAAGEEAVKAAFPEAVIVRPAKLFGPEDRFLGWLAHIMKRYPYIPLVDGGKALVQPVLAEDVAEALALIVDNPEEMELEGKVCELFGDSEYSWREVLDYVQDVTERPCTVVDLPRDYATLFGNFMEQMPTPVYTSEDAIQQSISVVGDPATQALTLASFGIKPTKMEEYAFRYLHRFRAGGHFRVVKGYH